MKYARIIDNEVIEVFSTPDGFVIDECFHEDIARQFIECPDFVEFGYTFNGTDYLKPIFKEIVKPNSVV